MLPVEKKTLLGIDHGKTFALNHIGKITFQSRMTEYLKGLIETIAID